MPSNKTADPNGLVWDASLKKTFKECQEWMESTGRTRFEKTAAYIVEELAGTGRVPLSISTDLKTLGHAHGVRAGWLSAQGQQADLPDALRCAVGFGALAFRVEAFQRLQPSYDGVPLKFSSSMKAAGTVMLSWWDQAATCASLLIDVAHKDQTTTPAQWRKDGWGKGTHDAFLIALFAQAFGLPTHYQPVEPLIPEYQGLLDAWRTHDEATYQRAMQAAIAFHISRSKNATSRNDFEFDDYFHRVYPAELLAVQALRRRDGLPDYRAGHALVDTPWAVIRELADEAPHPLMAQVEERMRRDHPGFR